MFDLFKKKQTPDFPNDADGDVLRRMAADGFDFSKEYVIDFVVQFDRWPIDDAVIDLIRSRLDNAKVTDNGDGTGEIGGTVSHVISYDFVMNMQKTLSEMAASSGGRCEVWGAMSK